jgi:hypothetical protein
MMCLAGVCTGNTQMRKIYPERSEFSVVFKDVPGELAGQL